MKECQLLGKDFNVYEDKEKKLSSLYLLQLSSPLYNSVYFFLALYFPFIFILLLYVYLHLSFMSILPFIHFPHIFLRWEFWAHVKAQELFAWKIYPSIST